MVRYEMARCYTECVEGYQLGHGRKSAFVADLDSLYEWVLPEVDENRLGVKLRVWVRCMVHFNSTDALPLDSFVSQTWSNQAGQEGLKCVLDHSCLSHKQSHSFSGRR